MPWLSLWSQGMWKQWWVAWENIGMLSGCARMESGKLRRKWNWIWSGMWKTTRRDANDKIEGSAFCTVTHSSAITEKDVLMCCFPSKLHEMGSLPELFQKPSWNSPLWKTLQRELESLQENHYKTVPSLAILCGTSHILGSPKNVIFALKKYPKLFPSARTISLLHSQNFWCPSYTRDYTTDIVTS